MQNVWTDLKKDSAKTIQILWIVKKRHRTSCEYNSSKNEERRQQYQPSEHTASNNKQKIYQDFY